MILTRIKNNVISYYKILFNFMCKHKKRKYLDKCKLELINNNNKIEVVPKLGEKTFINIQGENNDVIIDTDFNKGKIVININGSNNKINITNCNNINVEIYIYINGNNSFTSIDNLWVGHTLNILNGINIENTRSNNTKVIIESGCTIESASINSFHSNLSVNIGCNCMLSHNISLFSSDTHPIYDKETKQIINKPLKGIDIANNVWIGQDVVIMKGTVIPSGCIIGRASLVTSSLKANSNSIIAGVPAKMIKENIFWNKYDSNFFL